MAAQRYRMLIAYDGTGFHGFQRQQMPGQPPLRTVQGALEDALVRTVGQPVHVQGASRTDAGVHALGQVAHFDAETRIPVTRLASAINSRLDADLEVRQVAESPPNFNAISDAVDKQYRYRIWTEQRRPLYDRNRVYHCWTPLDIEAMHEAAGRLVGEHDFAAFAAAGHNRQSTVRTIFACSVEHHPAAAPHRADELHLVVRGDGFLYNMVRIIAGTLVETGRGRFAPDHIDTLLRIGDRALAGPTLPPQGLCLEWIRYRQDT